MSEIGNIYRDIGEVRSKIAHGLTGQLSRLEAVEIVQAIEKLALYLKRWIEAQQEID